MIKPKTVVCFGDRHLLVADEMMEKTLQVARKASQSHATVLISGESGTGKELIARYIHENSNRREQAFISVNCAAIPESLMESELFGYERGAFTGAVIQRIGKFERANHGTLLLDEIGDLPLGLQAKLLRVLQEGEVDRLGGGKPVPINTRVIASTNQDLGRLVSEGKFRADLFYRLHILKISCSPLRHRNEAIVRLAHSFLESMSREYHKKLAFSESALKKLLEHAWPGNIRELKNTIERAAVLSDADTIDADHIDLVPQFSGGGLSLAEVEASCIQEALRKSGGNRTLAAKELGISVRTIRNKLKTF